MTEGKKDINELLGMNLDGIIVFAGCSSKNTTGTSKGGCGSSC